MSMAVQLGVVPPFSPARKSSSSWFNSKQRSPNNTAALFMVKAKPNKPNKTNSNNYSTIFSNRLNNKSTPWLMLTPETDEISGEKFDRFYSMSDSQIVKINRKKNLKIPDTAICKCSTLGSWLCFADTKDGSLYLSNPFLNDVVQLPSLGTLPRVVGLERDEHGSILHFKVAFPDYKAPIWDSDDADCIKDRNPKRMADSMITHIALSCKDPRQSDCVAMAVQGEMSRLAYSHINKNKDGEKVWYGLQEEYHVVDLRDQIVYNRKNKLFYAMDIDGIKAFDVQRDRGRRSKKVNQFDSGDIYDQCKQGLRKNKLRGYTDVKNERYLLTLSNGDLWLIVRYYVDFINSTYQTLHFEVYRVAYPRRLERLSYLGDRAIFIGCNQSFCVEVGAGGDASKSNIRANCIYFTDHHRRWVGGHDMGIFNMKNGFITQFYPYEDEEEEKKLPFTMPLIWIAPFQS